MSILKATYQILTEASAVTALLNTTTSVYQLMADQEAGFPYIIIAGSRSEVENHKGNTASIEYYTVDVNIFNTSNDQQSTTKCEEIADEVKTALDRYTGIKAGLNIDTVVYDGRTSEIDEFNNGNAPVYIVSMGFTFRVKI